jgi:glycosyltransferase involved in cell wall biosynthesis
MNVWYFDIWGAIPIKGEEQNRPFRQNMIVNYLAKRGHNVTWFSSTFNHRTKEYRFNNNMTIEEGNKKIVLIHPSIGYKKNISIKRILNHIDLSKKLEKYINTLDKPDIIISSYPAIEVAKVVSKYSKSNNIPLIIDVRDLWPDLFETVFLKGTKTIGHLLLSPYYFSAKKVFTTATAITGVTDDFVKFGLKYADRKKNQWDKSFPFGYPDFILSKDNENSSKDILEKKGVDFNKNIICYFGSIGATADFSHIIRVANSLKNQDIQFVIGGLGDQLDVLKKQASSNVVFLGWITKDEIWTIMKYSKAGIVPFIQHDNFEKNLTNKMIEYLAGGLPILSNINGLLGELLQKYNCGFVYDSSEKKLLSAILSLIENIDLQKVMSNNARNLFEKNYLADNVYNDFVDYIEEINKEYEK